MDMDKPATLFLVDDDPTVRSWLHQLLKSHGFAAIVEYACAQEFLDAYDPSQPGCLVLDVNMPGMSGLELQEQLNLRGAVIPVIFMTGHGDVPMAVEAMQHGAFDFLEKHFHDEDLIASVRRALEKDRTNRAKLKEKKLIEERLQTLTAREREVMDLVVAGKANKVIAADLGVSQRTVEIHRARVMEKMQADSLAQLVRMVMEMPTAAG